MATRGLVYNMIKYVDGTIITTVVPPTSENKIENKMLVYLMKYILERDNSLNQWLTITINGTLVQGDVFYNQYQSGVQIVSITSVVGGIIFAEIR